MNDLNHLQDEIVLKSGSLYYKNKRIDLTKEIQDFKSCSRDGIFKIGIPLAVSIHFFNNFVVKNKGTLRINHFSPRNLVTFFGSACFGTFFYSPFCWSKFKKQVLQTIKEHQDAKEQNSNSLNENFITLDSDFQSDSALKYEGETSSYSHLNLDINPTFGENYENKDAFDADKSKLVKPPETTYDELRKHNRDSYRKSAFPSFKSEPAYQRNNKADSSQPILENLSSTEIYPKNLRNKYGDDME